MTCSATRLCTGACACPRVQLLRSYSHCLDGLADRPWSLPQALEARGSPPEDVRVLRALWNIFNAFNQPREELSPADGSDGSSPPQTSGNGMFPACQAFKRKAGLDSDTDGIGKRSANE